MRWLSLLVPLALASLVGCRSSAGSACRSAGGTCVIEPGLTCAEVAASSAQDCNTTESPGGQVCCVAFTDASIPTSGEDAGHDAASSGDASAGDAGGGACATDNDCPGSTRCGYPQSDGCAAKGVCVEPVACNGPDAFCACGGGYATCVTWGYLSAPTNGLIGPCPSQASDAGG